MPERLGQPLCILPWIHFSTNSAGNPRLCCLTPKFPADSKGKTLRFGIDSFDRIWNSKQMRRYRKDLLAGKWLPECKTCYNEEKLGGESFRLRTFKNFKSTIDKYTKNGVFAQSKQADGHLPNKPLSLELVIGNTCNLRCRMCTTDSSSAINAEAKKQADQKEFISKDRDFRVYKPLPGPAFSWIGSPVWWQDLKDLAKNLVEVWFIGGEPMIIPQVFEFLNLLEKTAPAKTLQIGITTNASLLNHKLINLMDSDFWGYSQINVSLDATDKASEYIRYPSQWSKLSSNTEWLVNNTKNLRLGYNTVFQYYNILKMVDLLSWLDRFFIKRPLMPYIHILDHPGHLRADLATENLRLKAIAQLNTFYVNSDHKKYSHLSHRHEKVSRKMQGSINTIKNYLSQKKPPDLKRRKHNFYTYNSRIDSIRNQEFGNVFPELAADFSMF